MSEAVLADAQFSIAKILRPYPGFEADYQGQTSRRPIAFPGVLDPNAQVGAAGYDPNLISAIPVPLGSKVSLWIPTVYQLQGEGEDVELLPLPYRWQVVWRMRNLQDYKRNPGSSAYHLAKQSLGANNQFIIPAAQSVVLFEGPIDTLDQTTSKAPGTPYVNEKFATHQGILERLSFPSVTPLPPFVPGGGTGAIQQGVATFTGVDINQQVTWNEVTMDARGDEMILFLDRMNNTSPNWNFTDESSVDFSISLFFGNGSGSTFPDLGVYVMTGSNP